MNICFVLQDPGHIYGAERATLDLVRGLRAQPSIHPHVLLMKEGRRKDLGGEVFEAFQAAASSCIGVPVERPLSVELVRRIAEAARDIDADVMHTVGYKANVHGLLARRICRHLPQVATVHGWLRKPDIKEQFYGWVDRMALKRATRVVALSSYYYDYLLKRGMRPPRVVRIPSGVDPAEYKTDRKMLAQHDAALNVGMLGRLSYEKNHEMFLDVAEMVKRRHVAAQFVIAGDGPLQLDIETQIAKRGLSDSVRLLGYTDVAGFMSSIDVLASCSRIENLPYSMLEAMACSRPVVATQVGGVGDLVQEGETGFLVELDDAEAMADRIVSLAEDRELVIRMGNAASTRINDEFTLRSCVARHLSLYADIATGAA